MNELKVVARLIAQERGEAVRLTDERVYALSAQPMVLVPITMAGESPSLFAIGIGDGTKPCRVYVCPEPRNRDQQYDLLRRAAADIENVLDAWQNAATMPQIITSSRDGLRVSLAVLHRMTYTDGEPVLNRVGRKLHWLDRVFERPDSSALLDMPAAICALYATGQDDHADAHLGVVMEWLKPADGKVYDRILRAEELPASTSTHPRLDNEKLVPRLEELERLVGAGDPAAERVRGEIESILSGEVERRYRLIQQALGVCRGFQASTVAEHLEREDRARHERNLAYVADPANRLAWGLSGNAATAEFLSRELCAEHVERLARRTVSSVRGGARLSGDILVGEVISRDAQKFGRRLSVRYQVRTRQDRSPLRRGDKLSLLDGRPFIFVVVTSTLDADGHTVVSLEVKDGKTKPGQPAIGDIVELAEPLGSGESIGRTMALAHQRLRTKPNPRAVAGAVRSTHDYLSSVQALRRSK